LVLLCLHLALVTCIEISPNYNDDVTPKCFPSCQNKEICIWDFNICAVRKSFGCVKHATRCFSTDESPSSPFDSKPEKKDPIGFRDNHQQQSDEKKIAFKKSNENQANGGSNIFNLPPPLKYEKANAGFETNQQQVKAKHQSTMDSDFETASDEISHLSDDKPLMETLFPKMFFKLGQPINPFDEIKSMLDNQSPLLNSPLDPDHPRRIVIMKFFKQFPMDDAQQKPLLDDVSKALDEMEKAEMQPKEADCEKNGTEEKSKVNMMLVASNSDALMKDPLFATAFVLLALILLWIVYKVIRLERRLISQFNVSVIGSGAQQQFLKPTEKCDSVQIGAANEEKKGKF